MCRLFPAMRLSLFHQIVLTLSFLLGISPLASAEETVRPAERAPTSMGAANTVAYTNSMGVLDDRRKLGVGDQVRFRVVEDRRSEATPLVVTDSGEMEVPLIGRVHATNKTCKQLAYEIKAVLEKEYYYRCNVIMGLDTISTKSRGRIYITGAVKGQGPLDIPADEVFTVSKAILRVGGFADFANRKKVKLVRKLAGSEKTETILVDVSAVLDKGKSELDQVVEPDDTIIVPERLINL